MIIGYRDFILHYSHGDFHLKACSYPYVWNTGVNEARCSTSLVLARDHLANGSCTCGFYAFKDSSYLSKFAPIHGSILMWGKVVEHEFGYRAEFAQLESLLMPNATICQKASHSVDSRDLRVCVDARPRLDPYTVCPPCMKRLFEQAGDYNVWWQSLPYNNVLSEIAEAYRVPLIKTIDENIGILNN